MAYRFIVTGALSVLLAAGCSGEDDPPSDATGGAGGEAGGGPACATDGTGTVDVQVSGLPDGLVADVVVNGGGARREFAESTTFEDVATGEYSMSAGVVLDEDPIVRTVYEPVVEPRDFCLEDGATQIVSVTYEAIPSSNKLWTSNLLGFPSSELAASGEGTPVVVDAPAGRDLAFDVAGNLWAFGGTLAEPMVVRLPASELGTSGVKTFDVGIDIPAVECIPAMRALAFDGPDLWLSVCGEKAMKFTNGMFADSGNLTPDATISGMSGNADIALNEAGLWVASGSNVLLYNKEISGESTSAAKLTLTVRDAEDSRDLDPTGITFDADGNLWGFCFGSNFIFKVAAADLDQTGKQTVTADVSFVLGVDVLVATGAFDDGGALWVAYGTGRLGRLSPDQLTVSSGTGDPVTPERVVTNDALINELNVAFFADPPGIPLAPYYD